MKLTDAKVRSLKAKTNRYEVWETGRSGFGLRVSASSYKSWFYFYRFEGKNRRRGDFKKGDVLKPASWAAPALNQPRGNVLEGNYPIQWTGPLYLN